MPDRPIIMFPRPEPVPRSTRRRGFSNMPSPTNVKGQADRIKQQFDAVRDAFVSGEPGDVERVLVMETSARIEGLQKAVVRIPRLEWLAEMDVDDIELHDLYDEETAKKVKGGRLYLMASNRQATDRLLGLWKKYQEGKPIERGLGVFKEMFKYLLTLRRWDVRDRLIDTNVLNKWKEDYEIKKGTTSEIDFEIELHYRESGNNQEQEIRQRIETAGGRVRRAVRIEEVAFHALKVSLPVESISSVIEHDWDSADSSANLPPLFRSEAVRYFRPVGQQIDTAKEPSEYLTDKIVTPPEDKPPVLALLDGAPLLRHRLLDGRIQFYDPDRYSATYDDPSQRKHGTAMASLMCHDDWSRPHAETRSLTRPIYVRPVMTWHTGSSEEKMPSDDFQEDIIERAVREMFESQTSPGSNIKVINLSLGNKDQHYLNEMSPWARMLDWLSFKYQVLFIVSAGNYLDAIQLDKDIDSLSHSEIRSHVMLGIDKNQRNHRLLSPAESMNALTVGALQSDSSGPLGNSTTVFDPIDNMDMPSPYSRIGPGYRGAVKPEVFVCGGRLLYAKDPQNASNLFPVDGGRLSGVEVACPGVMPGRLSDKDRQAGTSHAAAIASHGAGHIFEMLEAIRENELPSDFDAVLIKALLVHGASQGENVNAYKVLEEPRGRNFKRYRSRYLGYGNMNIEKVLECAKTRATAIGWGKIQQEGRHRFSFPLPTGGSVENYLRLTITLAWFSPINSLHIGLRRAKLFFEGDGLSGMDGHARQESDWQQVRKGTIQHEIFEMDKARLPGDTLTLFVECAADAGTLDVDILYGLAVTLEVAEQESIDLYQMVKDRITQPIRITGTTDV